MQLLSSEDEVFEFIPPECEPKIEPGLREKAIKVVAKISFTPPMVVPTSSITNNEDNEVHCSNKLSCFPSCKTKYRTKKHPATRLSARLKQASSQGFEMMKNILFPSIPAIFQDLWVYVEMAVAVIAFTFGALDTFQSSSTSAYTYVYFILAVLSFTLVLTDGYLYFIELGSCARGYKFFKNKWRKRNQANENSLEEEEQKENVKKCCTLSPKWKQHFSTWFEVIRNTVTELLLYPLLIFDLVSFIVERGYEPSDTVQRADFSLFVMESFYLILSVYIMRIVLVLTSMISLIKLPTDENGDDTIKPILVRFSVHMIGQIVVHLLVVLVVAAKINNENSFSYSPNNATSNDASDSDVNASYFLITAMVCGGIVPLAGSAMFFVVNYYWMRQFTITFWINMISLLQGESFAEAVFGGEGVSSKEKAMEFVQKSQFSKVKKELKKYKSPTLFTKLSFPTRIPKLVAVGVLYNVLFWTFIASLTLSTIQGSITLVVFHEDRLMSGMFIVTAFALVIANIHILMLINMLIALAAVVLVTFVFLMVLSIVLSVICIFPALGGIGFSLLLIDICSSLCFCRSYRRKLTNSSISNEPIPSGTISREEQSHAYHLFPDNETKL